MQKIHITTDCLCDLPDTLLKEFDIAVMYYYVITQHGRFQDRLEITSENMIELIQAKKEIAHTQVASIKEYQEFFARHMKACSSIIHISAGKNISMAYNHAVIAAENFSQVHVIDSGQLSGGLGIIVLAAAQWAMSGLSAEEILTRAETLKQRITTSFITMDAERMYLNGQISSRLKQICGIFHLHLYMTVKNGHIHTRGFYMGKAERYYKKYIRKQLKNKPVNSDVLFINYAGLPTELREKLVAESLKYHGFRHILAEQVSATVTCNCGLGAFGLIFVRHTW